MRSNFIFLFLFLSRCHQSDFEYTVGARHTQFTYQNSHLAFYVFCIEICQVCWFEEGFPTCSKGRCS